MADWGTEHLAIFQTILLIGISIGLGGRKVMSWLGKDGSPSTESATGHPLSVEQRLTDISRQTNNARVESARESASATSRFMTVESHNAVCHDRMEYIRMTLEDVKESVKEIPYIRGAVDALAGIDQKKKGK